MHWPIGVSPSLCLVARLDRYRPQLIIVASGLDANAVDCGVLVQPSFLGTDNSYLIEGIAAAGGRLRGIAVIDPATPPADPVNPG